MLLRTALALSLSATPLIADPVSFASGWQEQRLSLFSSNDYMFGRTLGMVSDGAVSIAWTRLPQAEWSARSASWSWTVEQSVPPTDLSRKGGDDRNLSVYFIFVPENVASDVMARGIRGLRGRDDVRIIQYAWGGNHAPKTVIPSPYGSGGVTIPLRAASTGSYSEKVDLSADYARAFQGTPGALIGMAVSGDSDDTNSVIRATLGNMVLR
jgi:hypothetical protein